VLNPRLDRKASPTHGPLIKKQDHYRNTKKERWLKRRDLGKTTSFSVGKDKVNNGQKTME
jgi:hypothetical protein